MSEKESLHARIALAKARVIAAHEDVIKARLAWLDAADAADRRIIAGYRAGTSPNGLMGLTDQERMGLVGALAAETQLRYQLADAIDVIHEAENKLHILQGRLALTETNQ